MPHAIEQHGWFGSDNNRVVGFFGRDLVDHDWSFMALMQRDADSYFYSHTWRINMDSGSAAKTCLITTMSDLARKPLTVIPGNIRLVRMDLDDYGRTCYIVATHEETGVYDDKGKKVGDLSPIALLIDRYFPEIDKE